MSGGHVMNCKNHFDKEAGYVCVCCGSPLCADCTMEINKKAYCRECFEKEVDKKPVQAKNTGYYKKSRFWSFCFSVIPGAGHMYLGLMNKGLCLMILFFSVLSFSISASSFLGVDWLSAFLIPTVCVVCFFYSVFDCMGLVREILSGRLVRDIELHEIKSIFGKININKRMVGTVLVVIGLLGTLNVFSDTLNSFLIKYFNFGFSLTSIVVPLLLVLLGFYLIQKGAEA